MAERDDGWLDLVEGRRVSSQLAAVGGSGAAVARVGVVGRLLAVGGLSPLCEGDNAVRIPRGVLEGDFFHFSHSLEYLSVDKEKYALAKSGLSSIALRIKYSASFNFRRSFKIVPRLE